MSESTARPRLLDGGVIVPMITPLLPDGAVDLQSATSLVKYLRRAGCAGVLVLGSTGEGSHLDEASSEALVEAVVAAGDGLVIANAVALSTRAAAVAARRWKEAGADAILAPPPSSFPLSQSELGRHFEHIAASAGEPVLAYHVPVRVPTPVGPQLLGELVRSGVLAGVKDSSGDLGNHRDEVLALSGCAAATFTGSENCIDLAIQAGFSGAIPGLANLYPRTEVALVDAARGGDATSARALQEFLIRAGGIYSAAPGAASFTAVAIGALKSALKEAGIIEHAALTMPFGHPTQAIADYVVQHLVDYPVEV